MTSVEIHNSVPNAEQTIATSQYDILDSHIKSKNIKTIKITTSDGSTLFVAFKRNFSSDYAKRDYNDILKTVRYRSEDPSMRCQTCIMGFMRNYMPLKFQDGKTLIEGINRTRPDLSLLDTCNSHFTSSGKFIVIDGPIGTEFEGGYNHLYINLPRCALKKYTVENFNWFINQHYPTLVRLMSENDNEGIIPSLELLLSLLPKVKYGDKIQKSTEWFHKYMSEYRSVYTRWDKNIVVLKALLNQYMVDGYGEEPIVATNLKQTKDTILNAMSCAHNESALVKMLTNLFNPTTYMRPTAPPSAGSLIEATNIFKNANFSTTVMTIDNLLNKYGGKAPSLKSDIHSGDDATSIWGTMHDNLTASRTKGKRGGAGGFAQRAITSTFVPTSICELFERLSEFPDLKINTCAGIPLMLTEFPDTANDLLKHDFLWAFKNGSTPESSYGINCGYNTVIAMTAPGTMGRNVFFGIKDAYPRLSVGNSCFPSFLKEGIQRKAGRAFESLNQSTSAKIPAGGIPLALGVGTSRSDSMYGLYKSLSFKYNNHVFTISKWE